MALADGFVFLPAQCGDRLAEELLGSLIAEWAAGEGLRVAGRGFSAETRVADVLADLRDAVRPCLFWFPRGAAQGEELDELFLLLNQKREVISQSAGAPLVMALHRVDWGRFRRRAPDFWSIHQAMFRFSPGVTPTRSLVQEDFVALSDRSAVRREGARRNRVSGWRLNPEDLVMHPDTRFLGRRAELDALAAMLGTPGARILVYGLRGIGKTALLRQACARVIDSYPDGIWWIAFEQLGGDSRERVRVILTRLLGEFGATPRSEEDLAVLQRLFRTATNSRKALFVFDDVDDAATIDALAPGEWASLLVSSSVALESPALTVVLPLGGLDSEAGAALLREHGKLDDSTARRLATALGGNPATIALMSLFLSNHPGAAPQLLAYVTTDDPLDDELLVDILGGLPEALRSPWSALGVFEGEFDMVDAAALAVDRDTLVRLTRYGFLEASSAEVYKIPPLLHKIARQRLEARSDSLEIHLAYIRRVLVERNPVAENRDVRSAVDWIRRQEDQDKNVPDAVWDILAQVIAGHPEIVLEIGEEVAQARHASNYEAFLSMWRAGQGVERGDFDGAEKFARKAIDGFQQAEDPQLRVNPHILLALVERKRGKLAKAERTLIEALTLADAIDDSPQASVARADVRLELAELAGARNDPGKAERLLREALEDAEEAGSEGEAAVAEISYELGLLARDQRDFEGAEHWLQDSLARWEKLGDQPKIGRALVLLADLAWSRGDAELASQYTRRGQALAEELHDKDLIEAFASMAKVLASPSE